MKSQLPYERPPLSKAVLREQLTNRTGSPTRQLTPTRPFFGLGRRAGSTRRKVVVASRTEYPYDKLLIATGSAPRGWTYTVLSWTVCWYREPLSRVT